MSSKAIFAAFGAATFLYTTLRTYTLYRHIAHAEQTLRNNQPTIILVLGGDVEREYAGVDLYHKLGKQCKLLISSGELGTDDDAIRELVQSGECIVDYRAVDTISNFTTTFDRILGKHKHVIVLTSSYHMERAITVAQLLLICGQGVAISPYAAVHKINEDDQSGLQQMRAETSMKRWRDTIRCLMYLYTGIDGGFLNRIIHPVRIEAAKRNTTQSAVQPSVE